MLVLFDTLPELAPCRVLLVYVGPFVSINSPSSPFISTRTLIAYLLGNDMSTDGDSGFF